VCPPRDEDEADRSALETLYVTEGPGLEQFYDLQLLDGLVQCVLESRRITHPFVDLHPQVWLPALGHHPTAHPDGRSQLRLQAAHLLSGKRFTAGRHAVVDKVAVRVLQGISLSRNSSMGARLLVSADLNQQRRQKARALWFRATRTSKLEISIGFGMRLYHRKRATEEEEKAVTCGGRLGLILTTLSAELTSCIASRFSICGQPQLIRDSLELAPFLQRERGSRRNS